MNKILIVQNEVEHAVTDHVHFAYTAPIERVFVSKMFSFGCVAHCSPVRRRRVGCSAALRFAVGVTLNALQSKTWCYAARVSVRVLSWCIEVHQCESSCLQFLSAHIMDWLDNYKLCPRKRAQAHTSVHKPRSFEKRRDVGAPTLRVGDWAWHASHPINSYLRRTRNEPTVELLLLACSVTRKHNWPCWHINGKCT